MKTKLGVLLSVVFLSSVSLCQLSRQIKDTPSGQSQQTFERFANLPLSFEINQGQIAPEVRLLSRGTGYQLFLTSSDAVMTIGGMSQPDRRHPAPQGAPAPNPVSVLRMKLVGSNPTAKVEGKEELEGKSNYFLGNDPKNWRTNVAQYAKVQYHDIYPGIDLVYYGNQGQLEHDFIVAPGM